jgi:PAS domain S-box-containing protein
MIEESSMEEPAVRPSVLVVDDAPENLMIMQAILAKEYSLKLFNDANDALDYAFSNPPDLILLDVMMPKIDGFEFCRRLKANHKLLDVPVIFITAKNDVDNEALGFSVGASDFIHKPISAPVLAARVNTHLKIKFMLEEQKTGRKQAEAALDELSQLNQSIITGADFGVMVYKADGVCILANEAAANIIGSSLEQIRHSNYRENSTWRNFGLLKAAEQALQTGITQKINAPVSTTYGKNFWCMASIGRIARKEGMPYLLVVFSDISAYKEIEREVIGISEETKRLVGQELHDDLGQHLTGIAFMSKVLAQHLSNQSHPDAANAAKITSMVNEAISKTRGMAHGLYPVELEEIGLCAMLQRLANSVESIYQTQCEFICDDECAVADSLAAINLFRIAQEAISNAIRHGKATKITLRMVSKANLITLEIADNGCGIDLSRKPLTKSGLGMHTMQYRASLLGASLHISAIPAGGTSIFISVPLKQDNSYAI